MKPMPRRTATIDEIKRLVGTELGCSAWAVIDQPRISGFADVTDDHNAIHLDPTVGERLGLGGTIAHGFLTLSMLWALQSPIVPRPVNATHGYNYGLDSVRFLAPVRCGKRIRGRFVLDSFDERKPGEWRYVVDVKIEIEGEAKPALAAKWLSTSYVP